MSSRSQSYPTPEAIATRAYSLWESNGKPEGTAEADWLQAEAELIEEQPDMARVATV